MYRDNRKIRASLMLTVFFQLPPRNKMQLDLYNDHKAKELSFPVRAQCSKKGKLIII